MIPIYRDKAAKNPLTNVENISWVYTQADHIDRYEGMLAYQRYHDLCQQMANRYDLPLSTVVAVFASLSPNCSYRGNVNSAIRLLVAHRYNRPVKTITVATYNHCRDRAWTYLKGTDFLDTVKGPKIRSFYKNILEPRNPKPVTIDGHAVGIWRNQRIPLKRVVKDGGFDYNQIAADYRAVASGLGILPNQLQATTWFTWKRIHRIGFEAQPNMFDHDPEDFWKTCIDLPAIAESIELEMEENR